MTPGRRPWLDKLEEKYTEEAVTARESRQDHALVTRVESLMALLDDNRSWGYGFLESVLGQLRLCYTLSSRQLEVIAKLESENTESHVAERKAFAERYTDESTGLRERALIAAKYYLTTPYFRDVALQVVENEAFLPTFSQYNKIVENKYAKKILAGHFADPKFPTGSLIQFRATSPTKANKKAMVISTNHRTPVSPSAGNKVYQVLPIGETVPVVVEEKHLKKWRT